MRLKRQTSLITSDDQQLRSAAPVSTSIPQPAHTSPLTSNFRLERAHCGTTRGNRMSSKIKCTAAAEPTPRVVAVSHSQ